VVCIEKVEVVGEREEEERRGRRRKDGIEDEKRRERKNWVRKSKLEQYRAEQVGW
jgi:hypothetical protein